MFDDNKSNSIEIRSNKIIKIEQKHKYASESPTTFAFAILFHVVCLFSLWGRNYNNLLIKNNKRLKTNPAEKCFTKLSIGARDFGKEFCLF